MDWRREQRRDEENEDCRQMKRGDREDLAGHLRGDRENEGTNNGCGIPEVGFSLILGCEQSPLHLTQRRTKKMDMQKTGKVGPSGFPLMPKARTTTSPPYPISLSPG